MEIDIRKTKVYSLLKNCTPQDDCRNLLKSLNNSTLTMIFSSPRTPVKKRKNSTFVTLIIGNFDILFFDLAVSLSVIDSENYDITNKSNIVRFEVLTFIISSISVHPV